MEPSPAQPLPDPRLVELLERSGEIRSAADALIRQMNELAAEIQEAKAGEIDVTRPTGSPTNLTGSSGHGPHRLVVLATGANSHKTARRRSARRADE